MKRLSIGLYLATAVLALPPVYAGTYDNEDVYIGPDYASGAIASNSGQYIGCTVIASLFDYAPWVSCEARDLQGRSLYCGTMNAPWFLYQAAMSINPLSNVVFQVGSNGACVLLEVDNVA